MNTNSNIYTVVYTTLVCVAVAAILAVVSQKLGPMQADNEKAETISQILTAAQFEQKEHWQEIGNAATIAFYKENLSEAFLVNANGEKVATLDAANAEVFSRSSLKAQNYNIKGAEDYSIPVYAFNDGSAVIAIYGAGLWGPVWGYVAMKDGIISGAYFDHESETPGLGGKIKDDPSFRAQLSGKSFDFSDATPFAIVKGGAPEGKANAIDAITGATMTSKGVSEAINIWASAYKAYLASSAKPCRCCEECQEEGQNNETSDTINAAEE